MTISCGRTTNRACAPGARASTNRACGRSATTESAPTASSCRTNSPRNSVVRISASNARPSPGARCRRGAPRAGERRRPRQRHGMAVVAAAGRALRPGRPARARGRGRRCRPRRCREPASARGLDATGVDVDRADELGDEPVRRQVVELARRADLLDHALVEHGQPVGDGHRLLLVVGDEDRGDSQPPLQPLQLEAGRRAQLRVEVRQRLVEQQHARLDRERARDRHALLLPAGELRRADGRRSRQGSRARASRARARGCAARGQRRSSSPNATFCATVRCGQSA